MPRPPKWSVMWIPSSLRRVVPGEELSQTVLADAAEFVSARVDVL